MPCLGLAVITVAVEARAFSETHRSYARAALILATHLTRVGREGPQGFLPRSRDWHAATRSLIVRIKERFGP